MPTLFQALAPIKLQHLLKAQLFKSTAVGALAIGCVAAIGAILGHLARRAIAAGMAATIVITGAIVAIAGGRATKARLVSFSLSRHI